MSFYEYVVIMLAIYAVVVTMVAYFQGKTLRRLEMVMGSRVNLTAHSVSKIMQRLDHFDEMLSLLKETVRDVPEKRKHKNTEPTP